MGVSLLHGAVWQGTSPVQHNVSPPQTAAWAQPAGPCTSAHPHSPCTTGTPPALHIASTPPSPLCRLRTCVSCFSLLTGCGITFSSPWTNHPNMLPSKKNCQRLILEALCSHHSPARGHKPRGVPAPHSRCRCIYLLLSPARGRGRTVATGSGCPSAATGSTVPGMLGAAETFPFTFAWVLVPFVPAQVYSQREGGKGNAAIILQPAEAEDQAKKGRLPQQNGLWGPPRGEDVGCWGAHVGLEYHGAPGSPAGGPKGRASHQDGARFP